MLEELFLNDEIEYKEEEDLKNTDKKYESDFVSEILKESNSLNHSVENHKINTAFSVYSGISDFQDSVWGQSLPKIFSPCNDLKAQDFDSTNDEMNLFNQFFESDQQKCQNDSTLPHRLEMPKKVSFTNYECGNIFVEQKEDCESGFLGKMQQSESPSRGSGSQERRLKDEERDAATVQKGDQSGLEVAKAEVEISFGNLTKILNHVFMGEETLLTGIPKLNFEEKWIIELFFAKIFKADIKFRDYNYSFKNLRLKIKKKKSKRSSEEMIKKIYRPFLREMFERFKEQFKHYKEELRSRELPPSLFEDKMKAFFYFLFVDSDGASRQNMDLALDILTERTNRLVYSKMVLLRHQNWETVSKAKFPTKISRSLRYLVSSNPRTRAFFKDFLLGYSKKDFSLKLKKRISLDLLEKIRRIQKLHIETENDFAIFKEKVSQMIFERRFKLQWPFWEIQDAVALCEKDLSNPKLQKEFEIIKSKHYTS